MKLIRAMNHRLVILAGLILLLSACQPAAPVIPTATVTPTSTATETLTPTPTNLPTFTPEPGWYQSLDPSLQVLKYSYAQVTNSKARVYSTMADAEANTGNFGSLPKYPAYVAYTTSRDSGGHMYYLTNYGWMKGEDLQGLTPSTFSGILLTREVTFRFGWVLANTESINSAGSIMRAYHRYQVIYEVPSSLPKAGYIAVGADEWLPASAVALVGPAVPADAGAYTCRFIYVNLASQILSVYNDCKLVFATLISSGQQSWTFEGRFAILYKVEYQSITPPAESTSEYYIEGVPYFMSYAGDFGFHAAYWHDSFGSPASHGCINLSPADGRWLYDWSGMGERVIISAGTAN